MAINEQIKAFYGLEIDTDALQEEYDTRLGQFMSAYAGFETQFSNLIVTLSNFLFHDPIFYKEDYPDDQRFSNDDRMRIAALSMRRNRALNILASGLGIENAKETLKRLLFAANGNSTEAAELTILLAHLKSIQQVRNKIAHNQATIDFTVNPCKFKISTYSKAGEYNAILFSSDVISSMTVDLGLLIQRFSNIVYQYSNYSSNPEERERLLSRQFVFNTDQIIIIK